MSSRAFILEAVKNNRPEALPLPVVPRFPVHGSDHTARFTQVLTAIGGEVIPVKDLSEVQEWLTQKNGRKVIGIEGLEGFNLQQYQQTAASQMEDVYWLVLKGTTAVAENGAVWLDDRSLGHRLLPFICQELVLVIEERSIVPTMHQAYEVVKSDSEGYGVFIAGPSKTADIEQSLVIGAHGPLNLHLFIIQNEKN